MDGCLKFLNLKTFEKTLMKFPHIGIDMSYIVNKG